MLLIDSVKYDIWTPQDEVKEFHPIIEEHAKEIFGKSSEYFDIKKRLESVTGKGSVPDGFVIVFGEQPCWHIVEIELSKHDLHDHIVNQISRFIVGINNPQTQRRIVNAINEEINKDDCRRLKIKKAIEPREIRQFLDDVIDQKPILTIIIEERTPELDEVLKIFPQFGKKVIEFKTFTRQGILSVHAHLFEPLYYHDSYSKKTLVSEEHTKPKAGELLEHIITKGEITNHRLKLRNSERWFFPDVGEKFELVADERIYAAYVSHEDPPRIRGISQWFKTNLEPKVGDKVIFEVIEPMKRYRLKQT